MRGPSLFARCRPSYRFPPFEQSLARITAEGLTTPGEYDNNGARAGWNFSELRPEQQPADPFPYGPINSPRGGRNGFSEGQFRRRQRAVTAGRRRRAGRRSRRDRRSRGRRTDDRGRGTRRTGSGSKAGTQAGGEETGQEGSEEESRTKKEGQEVEAQEKRGQEEGQESNEKEKKAVSLSHSKESFSAKGPGARFRPFLFWGMPASRMGFRQRSPVSQLD